MIGLDTNLVVRFLVQDDEAQAALASEVFASLSADHPGFIGSVVLAETSWVLAKAYKASREDIAGAIEGAIALRRNHHREHRGRLSRPGRLSRGPNDRFRRRPDCRNRKARRRERNPDL